MPYEIKEKLDYDDLVHAPDDGKRYELLDGERISTTRSRAPSIPRPDTSAGSATTTRSGSTTSWRERRTSSGALKTSPSRRVSK